jgi:hypothetical protein
MRRILRSIAIVVVATAIVSGRTVESGSSILSSESRDLVDSLYQKVVARHPLGIPNGADMEVFRPFLSKALLHKFDLTAACAMDWLQQRKDPDEKPSMGLIENGIFSGGDVKSEPSDYQIEKIRGEKDGSTRVFVKLTYQNHPGKLLVWYVAVVLVRENGRPKVNDVIFLRNHDGDVGYTLSKNISLGCVGAHWVG